MQNCNLIDREENDQRIQNDYVNDLSPWSRSRAKRLFDIAGIIVFLPLLALLLIVLALGVLVTSGAPAFFRQRRAGRNGEEFVIYKFRTMTPQSAPVQSPISIESSDRVTWFGAILRKSKLDELPQVLNILSGDMSLVGPRPKVPEQQLIQLQSRPGLTGPATLAFAREESLLAQIPKSERSAFYFEVILPAKQKADSEYLRRATMASDLRILLNTVLGRWNAYEPQTELNGGGRSYEPATSKANVL